MTLGAYVILQSEFKSNIERFLDAASAAESAGVNDMSLKPLIRAFER